MVTNPVDMVTEGPSTMHITYFLTLFTVTASVTSYVEKKKKSSLRIPFVS